MEKHPEKQTEKASRVLIEYGGRGNHVQLIQRMLIHLGYSLSERSRRYIRVFHFQSGKSFSTSTLSAGRWNSWIRRHSKNSTVILIKLCSK